MLTLFFLGCNSQEKSSKSEQLSKENKSVTISLNQIKAIYYINKVDKLGLQMGLDTVKAIDIDDYLKKIEGNTQFKKIKVEIENHKKIDLLRKADKWISIEQTINFAIDNSENVDFLEFFYKEKITNKLFLKYLSNKNQDWGSLSSSDVYSVQSDIISEIYLLNTKNRLAIITDFYNFMSK